MTDYVRVIRGFIIDAWGFSALFLRAALLAATNALILTIHLRRGRYPTASVAATE